MNSLILFIISLSISVVAQSKDGIIGAAVTAHKNADSYADWSQSEFNPEEIFKNLDAKDLCAQLENLSNENMNLFFAELAEYQKENPNTCVTPIVSQHETYLFKEHIELMSDRTLPPSVIPSYWGPSEEVLLDSAGGPRITDGNLPRKHLVLTFDDGPHKTLTDRLVRILKAQKVKVNFFVTGKNSIHNSQVLQRIDEEGHVIGTHSYSHQNLPKLKHSKGLDEVTGGFEGALAVLGKVAPYFRFPYGAHTLKLRQHLKKSNIAEFFWNIDTRDWEIKNPKKLLSYTLKQIEKAGGGVVLFHDIQPQTIAMMPRLLEKLDEWGYRSVYFTPKEWITE